MDSEVSPKLFTWEEGRQSDDNVYERMCLIHWEWAKMDCYFIRAADSIVKEHVDAVTNGSLWRLNFHLRSPKYGGKFNAKGMILNLFNRVFIFDASKKHDLELFVGKLFILSFGKIL